MAKKSASQIKEAGGKCEKIATDFWECTDKDGNVWWCSNNGKDCVPKPANLGPIHQLEAVINVAFAFNDESAPVILTVEPRARPTNR